VVVNASALKSSLAAKTSSAAVAEIKRYFFFLLVFFFIAALEAFFAAGIDPSLPKSVALTFQWRPCLSELWAPDPFPHFYIKTLLLNQERVFEI
jgi:hypothetical protein